MSLTRVTERLFIRIIRDYIIITIITILKPHPVAHAKAGNREIDIDPPPLIPSLPTTTTHPPTQAAGLEETTQEYIEPAAPRQAEWGGPLVQHYRQSAS